MYLTSASLPYWLVQRGLLAPSSITDGQFASEEFEFHNRGFRVYRPVSKSLYVKQLREFDRPNVLCLEREAAFGIAVAKAVWAERLGARVPAFLDYDPRHHAVTVELLDETQNLHETMEQVVAIPESVSQGLGRLIGEFHSEEWVQLLDSLSCELCPGNPPWILSFHIDQGAGSLSRANQQFLEMIQQDEQLKSNLDDLRNDWQAKSLMHGDLKWNNVLIRGIAPSSDWYIIDWEMVDRGDPRWDLATMIQCWWYFWILSTPPEKLTGLDDLCVSRHRAFEETRPSLDSLWDGYLSAMGMLEPEARRERLVVARFAAARMLQTVYELLNLEEAIGQAAKIMIEMSRRILEDPEVMVDFLPGVEA